MAAWRILGVSSLSDHAKKEMKSSMAKHHVRSHHTKDNLACANFQLGSQANILATHNSHSLG
jgi:hypothetical protein